MYNLKQKNAASINKPDAGEKTLFLDIADNKLKTKDENGDIEEISIANPNTPKVYKALLTQIGTSAPVATVLENTLGDIPIWQYMGVGVYNIDRNGSDNYGFTIDKTFITFTPFDSSNTYHIYEEGDENYRVFETSIDEVNTNNLLFGHLLIEVYP